MGIHKLGRLALAPLFVLTVGGIVAASGAGCSSNETPQANTNPVHGTSLSSGATSDSTSIAAFNVDSAPGSLVVAASDATGGKIASFKVTKVPVINYSGGVLPAIVIEETGAAGDQMHAESVSFYPLDRTDLSKVEFELFGVGTDNLIIRWAYNADGLLARISLFAYHGDGTTGNTRLKKFLSSAIHTAPAFDLPSNYASLDDYVDAWIASQNLDSVFNSPELDNVFFTMRDPSWIASVVNVLDPNTVQGVTPQSASLHLDNTGGGGTGSGGTGSGSGSGGTGSGGKTGSGGSGSGGSAGKPPKQGQASGCDTGSLGSFLTGVLGNVAKNATGSVSGAKACKQCVTDLGGSSSSTTTGGGTTTDAGTKTDAGTSDAGAKKPGLTPPKPSATKSAITTAAKTTKKPTSTPSKSNACSTCQKFLQNTGVTKAATCAIGKVTNGSLGSKKGGSSTNSKGNSPADDMSDDCTGSDCTDAPTGDTCTMGDDTCDMDPDGTDDTGNFDLGDEDDTGDGVSSADDFPI